MKNPTFKKHPNLPEYHETSDGTQFFQMNDAVNHSKTLNDKSVETVKNTGEKTEKAADKTEKAAKKTATASKKLTPMQEAKLKVKAIEAMETVAEIEVAIEGIKAKTVLKAAAAKIEAIKASIAAIETLEKSE
jgi:predicted phage tail protein